MFNTTLYTKKIMLIKKDERFKSILNYLDGNLETAVEKYVEMYHDELDVWSKEEVKELTNKTVTEWQHTA